MSDIFDELAETTHLLNSAADQASAIIRTTNKRLLELGAGVEYWSVKPLQSTEQSGGAWVDERLGYAKVLGNWRLGIRHESWRATTDPELVYQGVEEQTPPVLIGAETSPLLSAQREIRILAAGVLREFLAEYNSYLRGLLARLPNGQSYGPAPQSLPTTDREWFSLKLAMLPDTNLAKARKALQQLAEESQGGILLPTRSLAEEERSGSNRIEIFVNRHRVRELMDQIQICAVANRFDVVAE